MQRQIITTADGSKTIQLKEWNEQYHSIHGAIQESYHVFIKHGLNLFRNQEIHVLEIGFGTGLNAFITFLEASKLGLKVIFRGVEAYPVTPGELSELNFISELKAETHRSHFEQMHKSAWASNIAISDGFTLYKEQCDFKEIDVVNTYDMVYFDAFGARVQPELWTENVFGIMFKALKTGGVLVTYSAKGSVRRAMQASGFTVERLPGPPGKREMLRAIKP